MNNRNVDPQSISSVNRGIMLVWLAVVLGIAVSLSSYDTHAAQAAGFVKTGVIEHVPGADEAAVEADLKRMCRERLAGYMCPRSYDFGNLPRTATGKLPKRELRAKYWEGTGRSI